MLICHKIGHKHMINTIIFQKKKVKVSDCKCIILSDTENAYKPFPPSTFFALFNTGFILLL